MKAHYSISRLFERSLKRPLSSGLLICSSILTPCNAAPTTTLQPVSIDFSATGHPNLAVTASGTGVLTYQWRHFGAPIAGATVPTRASGPALVLFGVPGGLPDPQL